MHGGRQILKLQCRLVAVFLGEKEFGIFPDNVLLDPHLFEEINKVDIIGEEDVQGVVDHVAVFIQPGIGPSPKDLIRLDDLHLDTLFQEVDGRCQTRHPSSHD